MSPDELFDRWERAWSGRDAGGFESACAPDVQYEDPFTPLALRGVPALAAHARRLWSAFPDARVNATGPRLGDGRHACAPCKVLGTHLHPVGRFAATGRSLELHAVVYAELRDERLWRVRAFFDVYEAARQLGVLPRPGTMGERALLMLRGFGLRA